MEIYQALLLGIIQGITEWLPISSSGHLVIFQHLFGLTPPLIFDIILHLGSLIVILIVFFKEIKEIFLGVIRFERKYLKIFGYLIIASIPIGLVGFFLSDQIKSVFNNIRLVGVCLIVSAFLIYFSKYPKKKDKKLNLKNTSIIGIAQSFAILPGLSRSGSTISAALFQGMKREEAVKFSFLLAIPAILGATILEAKNISELPDIKITLIGFFASIVAGYFTLKYLIRLVKNDNFQKFAWYCLILGLICLII